MKWMLHTGDLPSICFGSPGALPIEMMHFFTTILINVELALCARRRVLATTRFDPEFF